MNFTKIFSLIVASSTLSATSVSAGSVRGVSTEDKILNVTHKRHLKDDKDNNRRPVPAPVFVAPVPPPAPVAPPTPKASEEWTQRCSTGSFTTCLSSSSANVEACSQCLFAQSTLSSTSSTGINACGNFLCGGCVREAIAFYQCGARVGNSVPAPVSTPDITPGINPGINPGITNPVQSPPNPVQVPQYTFTGCPEMANSGDECTIPTPYKYKQCDYQTMNGAVMRCVCSTLSPLFLCNEVSDAVPVPASNPDPVTIPSPATIPDQVTNPVPAPVPVQSPGGVVPAPADDGACSETQPKSGDSCTTGGLPWVYCCYDVDFIDGGPAPAGLAWVCSCLNSEKRYVCNLSGTAQCTTIIRPIVAVSDPVPVPVTVPDPVSVPVTVPDPVPAPVTVPGTVPVPVTDPGTTPQLPVLIEPNPDIPEFCLALGGTPTNGTSCEGVLPEGSVNGICGGEKIFANEAGTPITRVIVSCSCSTDNPIWLCMDLSVETVPPQAPDDKCDIPTPNTGDRCASVLNLLDYLKCTFMQGETTNGVVVSDATVTCECDGNIPNPDDATWNCDGTLPPISSPSLMPAGEAQPVSFVPLPTSVNPMEVDCPADESKPNDGDDCQGFLPESAMTEATCNYSETSMNGETTTTSTSSCTCSRNTGEWSCVGASSIAVVPAPVSNPDPVPVPAPISVPAPVPELVSGVTFSEFTCRPFDSGCSAPHNLPSDCDGTAACCPGNIINDWRTDRPTCKHN